MADSDTARSVSTGKAPDSTARVPIETLPSAPTLTVVLEDLFAMVAAEVGRRADGGGGRCTACACGAARVGWSARQDPRARGRSPTPSTRSHRRCGIGLAPAADERSGASGASDRRSSGPRRRFNLRAAAYGEAAELADRAGPIATWCGASRSGCSARWDELVRDAERDDGSDLLEEGVCGRARSPRRARTCAIAVATHLRDAPASVRDRASVRAARGRREVSEGDELLRAQAAAASSRPRGRSAPRPCTCSRARSRSTRRRRRGRGSPHGAARRRGECAALGLRSRSRGRLARLAGSAATGHAPRKRGKRSRAIRDRRRSRARICGARPSCGTPASARPIVPSRSMRGCTKPMRETSRSSIRRSCACMSSAVRARASRSRAVLRARRRIARRGHASGAAARRVDR